jgi:nicotinamidase-related amidase
MAACDPRCHGYVPSQTHAAVRAFRAAGPRLRQTGLFQLRDRRASHLPSAKHVDTLILTGSETDVCVLSTALNAIDLGYRMIIVKDGLCSSSNEAHDASLRLYEQRYHVQIELAEASEVMDAWAL